MTPPQASAGLIDTDAAQAISERARLKAMLERPELGLALEKMGLPPRSSPGSSTCCRPAVR